jgi:hypothetical protein
MPQQIGQAVMTSATNLRGSATHRAPREADPLRELAT